MWRVAGGRTVKAAPFENISEVVVVGTGGALKASVDLFAMREGNTRGLIFKTLGV